VEEEDKGISDLNNPIGNGRVFLLQEIEAISKELKNSN